MCSAIGSANAPVLEAIIAPGGRSAKGRCSAPAVTNWISRARPQRVAVVPLEDAPEPATSGGSDPVVMQVIEMGAVYQALHDLTEPLREAVVAVDIVGLSYRDAARALGTKEGTIMSRLHRGRSQLAAQLGPAA